MREVAFSTNIVDNSSGLCLTFSFYRNDCGRANCKEHRVLLFVGCSKLYLIQVQGRWNRDTFELCVALCQPIGWGPCGLVGSGCWQITLSPCRLRLCHTGRSGLRRVIYFTRHFAQRQEKAIGAECQQLPALPIFSIWTGTTFRT